MASLTGRRGSRRSTGFYSDLIDQLVEFAEWTFEFDKPQEGGTKRDHYEQIERQLGYTPEEAIGPDFPLLVQHIWAAFCSLSTGRTTGFSGPDPITFEQIKAWKELTGEPLSSREVEAIKRIDAVFVRVMNG